MTKLLSLITLALGLTVIGWTASSFMGSNTLALGVTLMIAALFCVGYAELTRYQKTTLQLQQALQSADSPVEDLNQWLAQLPDSLTDVVRQRIQGEYRNLPLPTLTPYLTGLLVMLGLLGTFIGMVETLKGAVVALEGNTELEAVRAGLAAPMKGLGMAFGTSVAGVCGSACLGLISTLSRRDRIRVSRLLDTTIDTSFRPYSLDHNRRETYDALQQQARLLPEVATQLGDLVRQLADNSERTGANLLKAQESFLQESASHYQKLSSEMHSALHQNLEQAAVRAVDNMQPIMSSMLDRLGTDMKQHHQHLVTEVEKQLSGLQNSTTEQLLALRNSETERQTMVAEQLDGLFKRSQEQLNQMHDETRKPLQQWLHSTEANSSQLAGISSELRQLQATLSSDSAQLTEDRKQLLQQYSDSQAALLQDSRDRLSSVDKAVEQSVTGLKTMETSLNDHVRTLQDKLSQLEERLQQQLLERQETFLQTTSEQYNQLANRVSETLQQALTEGNQQVLEGMQPALQQLIDQFTGQLSNTQEQFGEHMAEHIGSLASTLRGQLTQLRDDEDQRNQVIQERLESWHKNTGENLQQLTESLQQPLQKLLQSASANTATISDLLRTLQQESDRLSEKEVSLLSERQSLLAELQSTQEALGNSAAHQRQAIETLVTATTESLSNVEQRFAEQMQQDMTQLSEMMDNFNAGSVELSSLGESFHEAVRQFAESNAGLQDCLIRVENSLVESGSRSDEQLAYYVAQAREIIDHNLHSQQEIINQLRQLERERS